MFRKCLFHSRHLTASIFGVLLYGNSAMASLIFTTDASSYSASATSPAVVSVYLTDTSGQINAGGGLNSSAVQLQTVLPVPADPLTVLKITPSTPFDFNSVNVSKMILFVSFADLTEGVATDQGRVLLGTFSIGRDNPVAGTTTTFRFVPLSTDNTYLANQPDSLDSSIAASNSFTIAVPEPASLGLLAVCSILTLRRQPSH